MHPTLAGLYPFLLGSPARCAFLSYFMFIHIYLGSPARSRLSHSRSCPNSLGITGLYADRVLRPNSKQNETNYKI